MLTEKIKNKINDLFLSSPKINAVFYGFKTVNNKSTNNLSFVFVIEKKLSINEIPDNEILPSSVEIDGITYITDVIEGGNITYFSDEEIDNNFQNALPCSDCRDTIPPSNNNYHRPLLGGISIKSEHNNINCTLGFLALDRTTNALVGISLTPALVRDCFYTEFRQFTLIDNESNNNIYQSASNPAKIGEILRYRPFYINSGTSFKNYSLATMFSVNESDISLTDSWKQYNLTGITEPMQFATTDDIDNLLYTKPEMWISSPNGGSQQGLCSLKIAGMGDTFYNGLLVQNVLVNVLKINDIILLKSVNDGCPVNFVFYGYGAAVIANISNQNQPETFTPKIIGITVGAQSSNGFLGVSRIDRIAADLDIIEWTGQTPNYVNLSTKKFVTLPTKNKYPNIVCSGETYWQIGLTQDDYNCGNFITATANTVYSKIKIF